MSEVRKVTRGVFILERRHFGEEFYFMVTTASPLPQPSLHLFDFAVFTYTA